MTKKSVARAIFLSFHFLVTVALRLGGRGWSEVRAKSRGFLRSAQSNPGHPDVQSLPNIGEVRVFLSFVFLVMFTLRRVGLIFVLFEIRFAVAVRIGVRLGDGGGAHVAKLAEPEHLEPIRQPVSIGVSVLGVL